MYAKKHSHGSLVRRSHVFAKSSTISDLLWINDSILPTLHPTLTERPFLIGHWLSRPSNLVEYLEHVNWRMGLGVSSCLRGGEWHRQMNVLSQTQLQELTHEQTYTPQNKHELTATSSRLHPSHRKLEGRTHTLFWVIKPSATSNYLKRQQCCWSNLQQNFQHFLKRLALFACFIIHEVFRNHH